jgi:hypothetical protein
MRKGSDRVELYYMYLQAHTHVYTFSLFPFFLLHT